MARKQRECPHCGATFRAGRLACPECGSDAQTGWQDDDEIDYRSIDLDLPDRYGADETPPRGPGLGSRVLVIVIAAALAGVFALVFAR